MIGATGESGVEVIYSDENIWLTQKMIALLYNVETNTINYHLKKLFSTSELNKNQVVRNFRITAADGKQYNAFHYNTGRFTIKFKKCPIVVVKMIVF